MTEQMAPSLDFEAMRHAIEESDYDALVAFYADDAEMRMVNKNTTPSSPMVLHGKEEISELLRDVCGRAMTHHVEDEVVLGATTLELQGGMIVRQTNIEAWDE